uniref:Uncharacterized protein n=1 Tax=Anguilla anguilla TaxID=7936 RepID=A0A0E9R1F7_ANGAN
MCREWKDLEYSRSLQSSILLMPLEKRFY